MVCLPTRFKRYPDHFRSYLDCFHGYPTQMICRPTRFKGYTDGFHSYLDRFFGYLTCFHNDIGKSLAVTMRFDGDKVNVSIDRDGLDDDQG